MSIGLEEESLLEKVVGDIQKLPHEKIEEINAFICSLNKRPLNIREAALLLRTSKDTIYRSIKNGSLKASRLGKLGDWKIPYSEIERILEGKINNDP